LQKRVDTITINGKKREIPLAAFFRVKDGKIQAWLDMPLVILGPPPGAQRKLRGSAKSASHSPKPLPDASKLYYGES